MKKTVILLGLLLCCVIYAGPFDKAPTDINEAKARVTQYMSDNNDSLLKVFRNGHWENWDGSNKNNVYIISHGLNDKYDNPYWINPVAEIIANDPNAVILSVNWDHFSGTKTDKNWLASTWINAVSELLSEQLKGADIRQAVGHSYGAHLLAKVISQTDLGGKDKTVGRFIGLDPADENGTFVSGGLTVWNSDEIQRFWTEAAAKTDKPVETYKSSVICGTELPLGERNFLLAGQGEISPKSIMGDWGGGGLKNHSRATEWYVAMVTEKARTTKDNNQVLGGWFEADVANGATGFGNWTGVVNSDKTTGALEYVMPKNEKTGNWGDVFTSMARNTSDWKGTVLNPAHKVVFYSQYETQTWKDSNGDVWEYDPQTGKTTVNGKTPAGASGLGTNWETSTPGGNINSITDVLDGVLKDAESAGKDVLNDALEAFKITWKSSTGSIWDRLKNSIKGGVQGAINSVKANIKILIKKYLSLEQLEKIANWGLNKLLSLNPTLQKIFTKLGLNNINNIVGLCKDIFKLVKGLLKGGSFIDLLRNSTFLTNVLKNALNWGLDVLKNFLSGLITKFLGNLVDKIGNFINKVLGALGIKVKIDFQELLRKGVDAALNAGAVWVKGKVDTFLSPPKTTIKPTPDPLQTQNTKTPGSN